MKIVYYIVYFFLWLLSLLPFSILYAFSTLLYYINYYIIGYRKKVVFSNLRNSFPEKSEMEIENIAKDFYRYLGDYFFESLAITSLSAKQFNKRYHYTNPEVVNKFYDEGKSVMMILGHYNNWEWATTMPLFLKHKVLAAYKPLNNKSFDNLFKKIRGKFGIEAVPMNGILKRMIEYRNMGQPILSDFLADQRPLVRNIRYWTTFLNQDTPVLMGAERISRKMKQAVVFMHVKRVKRGHYEIIFKVLSEDASQTAPYEITELHVRELEKIIQDEPRYWFWSHKRWKHDKEGVIKWQKEHNVTPDN